MALNDKLTWPNVHPENKEETKKVNDAFFSGKAEKKMLSPGMQLYKLTSQGRSLIHNGKASPWWFSTENFGDAVGLTGVCGFAKHMKVSLTEYARIIAAVTEEWNAMDVIMKAKLKTPVYGFWGQCAQQSKKKGSNLNLPGHAYQFYIPGLTEEHIEQVSVEAASCK